MGIREPGVEGPDGHLDRKGNGKSPEGNRLHGPNRHAKPWLGRVERIPFIIQHEQIECPETNAQQLDREQESERATHGVDQELERGVVAVGTPPLVDEEVHRHQTHFPEDKEDQQIEGHKDAEHARFQEEEKHHIPFDAIGNGEGCQDSKGGEQRRQQDHGERETIHTQVER